MTQRGAVLVDQSERVFAVIPTYGERLHLVSRVIEAALENGVKKVILVDNGTGSKSKACIGALAGALSGKVTVVSLPENLGSAGGYKAGLERALDCADCEYIWLLDDDNAPANGALDALLVNNRSLNEGYAPDNLALLSLREDRGYLEKLAGGVSIRRVFPNPSAFMGINLVNLPFQIVNLLRPKRPGTPSGGRNTPIKIPYGPYGGLFFHKSVVAKVGYPDERFFVYHDDTEYTHRLTQSGTALYLIPSSVIEELDHSWYLEAPGASIFARLLSADSDFRVYYSTRNRVYFDKHLNKSSSMLYIINKFFFLTLLKCFSIKQKKQDRFALLIRAIRDGENRLLGRQKDIDPL
ncbi:glycosyltransferase [Candidatus Neomarinimicrobiota bacterium]